MKYMENNYISHILEVEAGYLLFLFFFWRRLLGMFSTFFHDSQRLLTVCVGFPIKMKYMENNYISHILEAEAGYMLFSFLSFFLSDDFFESFFLFSARRFIDQFTTFSPTIY